MDKEIQIPPMDEARRIAVEAALRRWQEESKRYHERLEASAIAQGFQSFEEKQQHEMNEWDRRAAESRKRLPEVAAAAGKTVEEYHRELFSNKDFIPPSPVPSFSQCDCEEHPNPWFCPAVLLEYRSQDRSDFWDYEELNRTRIETLSIKPDDKSGRLDSKSLEKAWDMIESINLPLPIWARAKPEILAMPRVDSTAPSNYLRQNTPSLVSASLGDSSSPTTVVTPRSPSDGLEHHILSKPFKRGQPKIRRSPFTAYEKRHITKIVKHPLPPARRTRSHKVALFYELDRNGHLIPSRGF